MNTKRDYDKQKHSTTFEFHRYCCLCSEMAVANPGLAELYSGFSSLALNY
uniref:Uncharacterized protein n=1 Tax=Anguilla anguilla TaxID=7936 RepID=A0A0E9VXN4_ANGAN